MDSNTDADLKVVVGGCNAAVDPFWRPVLNPREA